MTWPAIPIWLGRLAAAGLVLAGTATALAQTDGNDDPATAELPDLQETLLDERRALLVEVVFDLDGSAHLVRSDVTEVAPAAMDDGPELLRLVALDRNGDPLMALDSWDPRWSFQRTEDGLGEEGVYVGEGEAEFLIPFDPRIETVELYDQHVDPTVPLMTGAVRATIESYCLESPNDVNCEGFIVSDGDGTPTPAPTSTLTATATATATPTAMPTATATPSDSATATPTRTASPTTIGGAPADPPEIPTLSAGALAVLGALLAAMGMMLVRSRGR